MNATAIFGVPRSGTSWLGQLFNSSPEVVYRYQPLFSYAFKDFLNEKSSAKSIRSFYDELIRTQDSFVLQKKNISGNSAPRFNKENSKSLIWKEVRYINILENLLDQSDTKLIGIIRHPCAVLLSWFNAPKEFDPNWSLLDEWVLAEKKNSTKPEEFYGFQKWKEATSIFLTLIDKYPDKVKIITYSDLNTYTERVISELFSFSNIKLTDQTLNFIIESKERSSSDPYDVYRKKSNDDAWKTKLDQEIINEIFSDPAFIEINNHHLLKTL